MTDAEADRQFRHSTFRIQVAFRVDGWRGYWEAYDEEMRVLRSLRCRCGAIHE